MYKISREWCMPSGNTFTMRPVKRLLESYDLGDTIIDPFSRNTQYAKTWSNDLNPETSAKFHLPANEFSQMCVTEKVRASAILFDPPYSYRQCVEIYNSVGKKWLKEDQQQVGRWSNIKNDLTECLLPNGLVFSFGWNTNGFGKKRGFEIVEVIVLSHGSAHNDTLVTVERKI